MEVVQRILAVVVKGVPGLTDKLSWQGTSNGEFTVRSAYSLLKFDVTARPFMDTFFKQVWGVLAPERVRVFLWLVSNQVIMTNVERVRRHIGESTICQVCSRAEGSILHVLRDCPAMSGIWLRLIPLRRRRIFFNNLYWSGYLRI